MKSIFILSIIMLLSCNKGYVVQTCNCDEGYYELVRVENHNYTEKNVSDLFCCIDDKLEYKIETSQVTNEKVFDILTYKTELFLKVGNEHKNYNKKVLLDIIQNPLLDPDKDDLIRKVKATKDKSVFKQEVLEALEKMTYN